MHTWERVNGESCVARACGLCEPKMPYRLWNCVYLRMIVRTFMCAYRKEHRERVCGTNHVESHYTIFCDAHNAAYQHHSGDVIIAVKRNATPGSRCWRAYRYFGTIFCWFPPHIHTTRLCTARDRSHTHTHRQPPYTMVGRFTRSSLTSR